MTHDQERVWHINRLNMRMASQQADRKKLGNALSHAPIFPNPLKISEQNIRVNEQMYKYAFCIINILKIMYAAESVDEFSDFMSLKSRKRRQNDTDIFTSCKNRLPVIQSSLAACLMSN